MAIGARNTSGTKEKSEQPQPGPRLARLVGVAELGIQPGFEWQGDMKPATTQEEWIYELKGPKDNMADGRPFWVSEGVKVSSYEPTDGGFSSKMMTRVRALEQGGVDTQDGKNTLALLGEVCMVETALTANGWAKLKAVTPAPAGLPVDELKNEPVIFDWDEPSKDVWNRLGALTKRKIQEALDYPERLKPWVDALEG
jgi:hypothetical protein